MIKHVLMHDQTTCMKNTFYMCHACVCQWDDQAFMFGTLFHVHFPLNSKPKHFLFTLHWSEHVSWLQNIIKLCQNSWIKVQKPFLSITFKVFDKTPSTYTYIHKYTHTCMYMYVWLDSLSQCYYIYINMYINTSYLILLLGNFFDYIKMNIRI